MQSLFAALGLVFVAELGDKTQMVALTFGARHKLAPVLIGVALAYMATNLLSVLIGGLLGERLFPLASEKFYRRLSLCLLVGVAIGSLIL